MPDALEQKVAIFPDSSGKNVRTLQLTTLVDGVETTTQMQVIAVADAAGNILRSFADERFEEELLGELRAIRVLLEVITEQ